MDMLYHREQDAMRRALFPNLDYTGLHQSLVALVDIMPLIQSGIQGRYSAKVVCCWCLKIVSKDFL